MKRLILIVFTIFLSYNVTHAQEDLNLSPDNIMGEYEVLHQGEYARVRVVKDTDSTYSAQVFWIDDMYDRNGKVRLDHKNPDKSLRTIVAGFVLGL